MKTMHEEYGEPNDKIGKHICCSKCGHCVTCKDCKCDKKLSKPGLIFILILMCLCSFALGVLI